MFKTALIARSFAVNLRSYNHSAFGVNNVLSLLNVGCLVRKMMKTNRNKTHLNLIG